MTREFRTEVYLLISSELRVVISEKGKEQPVVEPVLEYTLRGGSAMGRVHFFVPTVSRCTSPLVVGSRPTSPPTTVTRAMSPPTRLPLMVASVHRPLGAGVYKFIGVASNIDQQVSILDKRQRRRQSDTPVRRLLSHNPDKAEDRLC